ncbi:MAG: competence/damage-inducible protein A [Planctomycetes bacterium]|nr:competence/damage-inducible protein A [Planctomycetota bacterium]
MSEKTAIIFCVGRELLEGHVLDRNAHYMAAHLTQAGVRVRTIQVLDDVEDEIVAAVRAALALKPAYVLMSGGMGPGVHDLTRSAAAKAAEVPLVQNDAARTFVANSYRRWLAKGIVEDAEISGERTKLTMTPKGATCWENFSGTAPAICFEKGGTKIFLLPGQPEEMRSFFNEHVRRTVEAEAGSDYRDSVQIDFAGGDESMMPRILGDLGRRHPKVQARSRLLTGDRGNGIRITLSVEGGDRANLNEALSAAAADVRARLGLEIAPGRGRSLDHEA